MNLTKTLKTGLSLLLAFSAVSFSACGRGGQIIFDDTATASIETLSSQSANDEYIIKRKGLTYLDDDSTFEKKYNLQIIKSIPSMFIDIVKISSSNAVEELKSNLAIEYIEPNYIRNMKATPAPANSASVEMSSSFSSLSQANNIFRGKSFITIAVVGTGVDTSHPDLKDRLVPGYTTFGENYSQNDINGSGTHMAGVILGSKNGQVRGVAPECKVMPIKAMDESGQIKDGDLIEGIAWAVQHGANVVTLTAEGAKPSKALDDIVKFSFEKKVPIVVGSGDNSTNRETYPAATKGVIAVSATNNNNIASFSNRGQWVSVSAPGSNVLSTTPLSEVYLNSKGMTANYSRLSGSSVAAAYVAGEIALIKSRFPSLDMPSLKKHLELTSDDLGTPGPDSNFGYGRINPTKALMIVPPSMQNGVKR